jgi:hypothetical protein
MAKQPDPQAHYRPGAQAAADTAREAQAIRRADDVELIDALARMEEARLAAAPEAALEAELTRRGFHYDEEKHAWVK